jgi:hypothetical protein
MHVFKRATCYSIRPPEAYGTLTNRQFGNTCYCFSFYHAVLLETCSFHHLYCLVSSVLLPFLSVYEPI